MDQGQKQVTEKSRQRRHTGDCEAFEEGRVGVAFIDESSARRKTLDKRAQRICSKRTIMRNETFCACCAALVVCVLVISSLKAFDD